jgi:hypothetical protein
MRSLSQYSFCNPKNPTLMKALQPPFARLTFWLIVTSLCFLPKTSQAQCGQDVPTSITCETAPTLCLVELCLVTTNNPFNCCNGWCGANTAIHNPQFFAFTVTDTEVVIDVEVTECSSGNGLQAAILDACPWDNSNVVACDPGTPPGGTMTLTGNLTIGNTYWLIIDGSAGATCEYIIRAISGVNTDIAAPELTLDNIAVSETVFCAGTQDIIITADSAAEYDVFFNVHTTWNFDTITSFEPIFDLDIPLDAPAGEWEICVWTSNGCDNSNTICIPVTIDTFITVDAGVTSFCPEAFPLMWGDLVIEEPGTYTQSFAGPDGCRVDSTWVVLSYPEVVQGVIDTVVCAYQFNYESIPYDESGTYELSHPGQGSNGCDSFTILNLTLQEFEFFIEVDADEDGPFLNPFFTDQLGQFDTLLYSWFTCDSILVSTDENFRPDTGGCYCVVIEAGACTHSACGEFLLTAPGADCNLVADASCIGTEVDFSYPGDPADIISYDWIIQVSQSGAVQHRTGATETLLYAQPGTYHVSLTVTDSAGIFTCQDSIHIDPALFIEIAEFSDSLQATQDSSFSYTWRSCDNSETYANTSYFLPDSSGCYCVDVVNSIGCTDSDCVAFIISSNDNAAASFVGIYPNPSTGQWQISISETVGLPVHWQLYNVQGMEVDHGALIDHVGTLTLKQPLPGMYVLQLANATGHTSMHKLMVK